MQGPKSRDITFETEAIPQEILSPFALRALEEVQQRRTAAHTSQYPIEIGGRGGLDPSRFGDWEKNGIAVDF